MVKLASARESRTYGPRPARNRWEYINAGLYLFATVVLLGGLAAQFSSEPKSGVFLLLIALALIILVINVHDLAAHLSGFEYRLQLMGFDPQLAFVEFAVPVVQVLGSVLFFLGILFHFIQSLIAGPSLWVLGSIHNSCQIYERAGGHVQMLQRSVQIPFLMGSLLFVVGAILNYREQASVVHHGLELLVFKMQQTDGLRLEKLRGGAQERLMQAREDQIPLVLEDQRRRTASRGSNSGANSNSIQGCPRWSELKVALVIYNLIGPLIQFTFPSPACSYMVHWR
ncbi:hypothetical protein CJ030_MR7G015177 [Morella rubra]|uniref:Uncharacterized protein n=1 Tax=Morella rubra TaxID=262757 RepID=A0A6A1UX82_9ROSI|nr:hypothetical protein CJ030_MR7G015177 [Morella rubra]